MVLVGSGVASHRGIPGGSHGGIQSGAVLQLVLASEKLGWLKDVEMPI